MKEEIEKEMIDFIEQIAGVKYLGMPPSLTEMANNLLKSINSAREETKSVSDNEAKREVCEKCGNPTPLAIGCTNTYCENYYRR